AQEEDRKREPERGVEEDQAEDRVEDPDLVVEREDRDERHLQRYDEQRHDGDERPIASGKVEPGEGVPGESGDEDREERAADRDPDRRQERVPDRLRVPKASVVLEGQKAWLAENAPPASLREVLRRDERRDEEPEGRYEPE